MMAPNKLTPKTTGIGIVCGLTIQVNADCSIEVSQGFGITSEGYPVSYPGAYYKYFRRFEHPEKVFQGIDPSTRIWELRTKREGEQDMSLVPQEILANRFIDDKILLLFIEELIVETPLEEDEKDQDADPMDMVNGSQTSDNPTGLPVPVGTQEKVATIQEENQPTAIKIVRTVKPLVIDKREAWEIIRKNIKYDLTCLLHSLEEEEETDLFDFGEEEFFSGQKYFFQINRNTSLRKIEIPRFGIAADRKICDEEKQEFIIEAVFPLGEDDPNLLESVLKEFEIIIVSVIEQLRDCLEFIDKDLFTDVIPVNQRRLMKKYIEFLITQRFPDFSRDQIKKLHIQYFWDFCRDMAVTYNQLVDELCDLMADCCPDPRLFPRYVWVGELTEEIAFGPSVFRSHFQQPPVYNQNAQRLERIRFLHWRIAMMIKCFYIPGVESSDIADDHFSQVVLSRHRGISEDTPDLPGEIRITPARAYGLPEDHSTIPFYYYTAKDPNSIIYFWNYDATRCSMINELLSYHANVDESYTTLCSIKTPFGFDIRSYPFYRIEGHIGDHLTEVLRILSELKARHNLEFDVIHVSLEDFFYPYNEETCQYPINPVFYGAEHLAGVERGGTFILIYENEKDPDNCLVLNPVRLDMSLSTACCLEFKRKDITQTTVFIKGKIEIERQDQDRPVPASNWSTGASAVTSGYDTPKETPKNAFWNARTDEKGTFCFVVAANINTRDFSGNDPRPRDKPQDEAPILEENAEAPIYTVVVADERTSFVPSTYIHGRYIDDENVVYKVVTQTSRRRDENGNEEEYSENVLEVDREFCITIKQLDIKLFIDDRQDCVDRFKTYRPNLTNEQVTRLMSFTERELTGYRLQLNKILILLKLEQVEGVGFSALDREFVLGVEEMLLWFVELSDERIDFNQLFCLLFGKIGDMIPPVWCDRDGIKRIPRLPVSGDEYISLLGENRPEGNINQAEMLEYQVNINLISWLIKIYLIRAILGNRSATEVIDNISLQAYQLSSAYQSFDIDACLKEVQKAWSGQLSSPLLSSKLSIIPRAIKTLQEADSMLAIIYAGMNDEAYYGRMMQVYGPLRRGYLEATERTSETITAALIGNNPRATHPMILASWRCIYLTIARCTRLLKDIEAISLREAERKRIKGECRFIRALAHFDALRLWGHFWSSNSQYGVPIVAKVEDINNWNLERSSVLEVYEFIIGELEEVVNPDNPLLPPFQGEELPLQDPCKPTLHTANALLGRVYLYVSNYNLAMRKADEVINNGRFDLVVEYRDLYNGELISGIDENGETLPQEHIFAICPFKHIINKHAQYHVISNEYRASVSYRNVFKVRGNIGDTTDIEDIRLPVSINENNEVLKYGRNVSEPYPAYILRLAELYLIRAEVKVRMGDNEGGLEDLNVIRERARVALSGQQVALELVLQERDRELAFEGSHEWFDYVRMNANTSNSSLPGPFTLPIPQRIVDLYPNLDQVPETEDEVEVSTSVVDDLKIIEGIGPAIEKVLNAANIKRYRQLAATSVDTLKEILRTAGSQFSSHDPVHWPAQARLASEGKWEELKQLMDDIKNNRN